MTRNEKQAEFIKRFINNLGDVKNWEHNGEVVELPTVSGTCVCGHSIKFLYYIEEENIKDGEPVILVADFYENHLGE